MMHIKKDRFALLSDGREVSLYTLDNGKMKMSVTNYGACITSVLLPAKNGLGFDDVVLGYATFEGYVHNKPHFGSLLGRFAGRISNACFKIDGKDYVLTKNEGKNCLHGGFPSYDNQLWNATCNSTDDNVTVFLERYSSDGEQGFPGGLQLLLSYTLTRDNEIVLRYYAKTDNATFVNLTNHTYFNLNPAAVQDNGDYVSVLNHELLIPAEEYLETDESLLPTGRILPLENSIYDFRKPRLLKDVFGVNDSGLDTTYVIKKEADSYKALACVLNEPISGRMLRVYSTQAALTVYTANQLKNEHGKGNALYNKFSGICLESQAYPDSPNQEHFPTSLLQAEQTYNQETIWYFTF